MNEWTLWTIAGAAQEDVQKGLRRVRVKLTSYKKTRHFGNIRICIVLIVFILHFSWLYEKSVMIN